MIFILFIEIFPTIEQSNKFSIIISSKIFPDFFLYKLKLQLRIIPNNNPNKPILFLFGETGLFSKVGFVINSHGVWYLAFLIQEP